MANSGSETPQNVKIKIKEVPGQKGTEVLTKDTPFKSEKKNLRLKKKQSKK